MVPKQCRGAPHRSSVTLERPVGVSVIPALVMSAPEISSIAIPTTMSMMFSSVVRYWVIRPISTPAVAVPGWVHPRESGVTSGREHRSASSEHGHYNRACRTARVGRHSKRLFIAPWMARAGWCGAKRWQGTAHGAGWQNAAKRTRSGPKRCRSCRTHRRRRRRGWSRPRTGRSAARTWMDPVPSSMPSDSKRQSASDKHTAHSTQLTAHM